MKVRNFPLSFTSTAFAWFTSLPTCSIGSWAKLEEKFHNYFYNGAHETRLSHLTSVRQGCVENRCFHLMISKRDLADLCFASLCRRIREKLEHYEFVNVNQLLQKAISVESCLKESHDAYK